MKIVVLSQSMVQLHREHISAFKKVPQCRENHAKEKGTKPIAEEIKLIGKHPPKKNRVNSKKNREDRPRKPTKYKPTTHKLSFTYHIAYLYIRDEHLQPQHAVEVVQTVKVGILSRNRSL